MAGRTGRAGGDGRGRLQPDLAAARRRIPPLRDAAAGRQGPRPRLRVGHSYEALAPRETVGVDIDPAALAGQARETHAADMRALPFADGSFDAVLSVQSLEHVPDPERAAGGGRRVLAPGGTAVFVTPNRLTFGPAEEIVDPYHFVEFSPDELRPLCAAAFGEVDVRGIAGSPGTFAWSRRSSAARPAAAPRPDAPADQAAAASAPATLRPHAGPPADRPDPAAEQIEPGDFALSPRASSRRSTWWRSAGVALDGPPVDRCYHRLDLGRPGSRSRSQRLFRPPRGAFFVREQA